jgi:hypothetical protein
VEIVDKKKDRVFVLACGKSCDLVDYLEFLRGEYVIAISRWLFFDGFKFDFYFVNDTGLLTRSANTHGGLPELKSFCNGNSAKWFSNTHRDLSTEALFGIETGQYSYRTNGIIPCRTKPNTELWQLDDEEFLNSNGTMPVENPYDYFSDANFSQYKIKGTGCGTATRCAVDLAYFLKFKNCYLMNVDTFPIEGAGYSKHILKYAVPEARRTTPYLRNGFFDVRTWGHRYGQYRGMNLRRIVPENMFSQEIEIAKTSKKVAKNVGMFKTILYENLICENEKIEDITYNHYVI